MRFNELLEYYMIGKIDVNCLYSEIRKEFDELLNDSKFRELDYLKVYPFMSELQDEDLYKDHILDKKIIEIDNILSGQKNFSFSVWMYLDKVEMELFNKIWNDYKDKNVISFEDYELLQKELLNEETNIKTIEDMYIQKLRTLLIGLPIVNDNFYTYNLLYADKVDKKSIYDETQRLMDILCGEKPAYIVIRYACKDVIYTIL